MNETTLFSLTQIMQDGFIQHDKQESAGRFLLESVTIQEDSLCTTDLNSKKISRLVSRKDPVPDDIKQAALRNDIAVKVEEYFRQKVMSDINPYTKDDLPSELAATFNAVYPRPKNLDAPENLIALSQEASENYLMSPMVMNIRNSMR